jgi:TolA-binding protein
MSNEPRALSLEEISQWIRDAAVSKTWRPSHRLVSGPVIISHLTESAWARFHSALERARRKTFVKMVKPFRRIFRNQGAVNDSLIEAIYQLGAQNQEMQEEISHLRSVVRRLQIQLQSPERREAWRPDPAVERRTISAGEEVPPPKTSASRSEASDGDGSCE